VAAIKRRSGRRRTGISRITKQQWPDEDLSSYVFPMLELTDEEKAVIGVAFESCGLKL
jgi:hypothetical protein